MRHSLSPIALFVGLLGASTMAQTGGVSVRVLEPERREPVVGATVTLSNVHGLVPPTAQLTDDEGRASFPVLRVGEGYAVRVAMSGFATVERGDVTVNSGRDTAVEIVLLVVEEEHVAVTATGSIVDLDRVGASARFSAEFIESLPQRGREYQDVLPRTAGVLDSDGDGNPNVHGARTRDFRAEVAGVSNVDPLTGQWLSHVNLDSIQELEVLPTGAGVEFGRAQGGFARILQKQGTNQFEGVFGLLYRTSKLDGDGAGNVEGPTPEFDTLQPSLQLSGPIVRDKLWYRLSHEYLRREDPVDVLGSVEVSTLEQTIIADQLTWQASPRNRLTFQLLYDPLKVDNLGIDSRVSADASQRFERGGTTWSVGWTAPVSSRFLVDTTVAWQDHTHDIGPTNPEATQDCMTFSNIGGLAHARCVDLTNNRVSGPYNEISQDKRQRLTARSQATFFRNVGSQGHQIKLGMLIENERYFRELERTPSFDMTIRIDPFFDAAVAAVSLAMWGPRATTSKATGNNLALYVEDQWKPMSNLVVTAGLRFDREELSTEGYAMDDPRGEAQAWFAAYDSGANLQTALRQTFTAYATPYEYAADLAETLQLPGPSYVQLTPEHTQSRFWSKQRVPDNIQIVNENLAPRLAVNWDPWANGKTKIAVSLGRYYDKNFLAVPLVEQEPLETHFDFSPRRSSDQAGNYYFYYTDYNVLITPFSVRLIDDDLRTPYQDELALTFEREILPETMVRASYVRRRFEDQLQDVDINHLPADHGRCIEELFDLPFDRQAFRGKLVPSPYTGPVADPFTGEIYQDTDPGMGDGRLDDCLGGLRVSNAGSLFGTAWEVPDGRPDLYVQNPAWEEILQVGNYNRADYRAVVLELVRRRFRNWEMLASYTWSEAKGDAEDFLLLLGNNPNLKDDERGYLDYDQRHVVKVDAAGFAFGFHFGGAVTWQSGLPYSLLVSQTGGFSVPPQYPFQRTTALRSRYTYSTGQRNDQRNDDWWNLDLRVARPFRLGRDRMLQLSLEAFNVLNDDTLVISSRVEDPLAVTDTTAATRRFGRRWQLGLRLSF